jgi:hypothetical protein
MASPWWEYIKQSAVKTAVEPACLKTSWFPQGNNFIEFTEKGHELVLRN